MKKIIFAFNWKMNPIDFSKAKNIAKIVKGVSKKLNVKFILIPPCIYIKDIIYYVRNYNILIGAQNISSIEKTGALTGEVSAEMLKKIGVRFVIIGHSERRYLFGENDDLVSQKVISAKKAGLVPIVCVGEKNKMNFNRAKNFIIRQLFADLDIFSKKGGGGNIMLAYEPVWAIGGNKKINLEWVVKMIEEIKKITKRRLGKDIKILYGGSVNCENVEYLMEYNNIIDGFLIGSASVDEVKLRCIIDKIKNK